MAETSRYAIAIAFQNSNVTKYRVYDLQSDSLIRLDNMEFKIINSVEENMSLDEAVKLAIELELKHRSL